ncbi:uncharacterized protein LOC131026891 isoform X1 [Cryptomeria japonica]|uniref:uncharacterized protein LOC131026891 isoform X1 n=1 Tax=Cryptomeria japonica TaxID=3369 RepID=UPI0027DA442F|nr:uncharacterized protein LOC131026891 isoform X1 [Cryptomeria japonica]
MVCVACLLPIFLIPIVNLLPILFDFIVGKIYVLFGKEYRRPERVPPACPYKPANKKVKNGTWLEQVEPGSCTPDIVASEKLPENGKESISKEE